MSVADPMVRPTYLLQIREVVETMTEEELQELSKGTLKNYIKEIPLAVKHANKMHRRMKGMSRAVSKLAESKTVYHDSSKDWHDHAKKLGYHVEFHGMGNATAHDPRNNYKKVGELTGKHFQNSPPYTDRGWINESKKSATQIDELSRKTVERYAKKAVRSQKKDLDAGHVDALKRFYRRQKGLKMAGKRVGSLAMEEIQEAWKPSKCWHCGHFRTHALLKTSGRYDGLGSSINPHKPEKNWLHQSWSKDGDKVHHVVMRTTVIHRGERQASHYVISGIGKTNHKIGEVHTFHHDQNPRRRVGGGDAEVVGIVHHDGRHEGHVPDQSMPQYVYK